MMHYIMMAVAFGAGQAADDTQALVDRVQGFYEKTTDFTAEFKQDYTYKAFKRTTTSTGKLIYKRAPDGPQMRWDYEKPDPKTFLLASEKVALLDPQALTLTISPMSTDKLSASITFLWGKGKLASEFNIVKKPCEKCTGTLLEMTPLHPDARFKQVRLEVDPKSAMVLKSTVVDPDGSENAISFTKLETNKGLEDAAFKLKPPAGTQIIDMTKAMPKDGG
jgi:outer membrane lipoprotein carrier protein